MQNKEEFNKAYSEYIELKHPDFDSFAKVYPLLGGSVQELTINNNRIIYNQNLLEYFKSFSSSILFPFTGRMENANYSFLQNNYNLKLNFQGENSAIHGLVYNKPFKVKEKTVKNNEVHLILEYIEREMSQGFPFKYGIELHYVLSNKKLNLTVSIKNIGLSSFPFSLGWHPYFYTSDLYNSYIKMISIKKFSFSKKMIPIKTLEFKSEKELQIKERKFDDCYKLKNNKICFKTPDYNIEISSSAKDNYLQLYTPISRNYLAIEPLTGPPNNFNNKIDLQILKQNETYIITWIISLK